MLKRQELQLQNVEVNLFYKQMKASVNYIHKFNIAATRKYNYKLRLANIGHMLSQCRVNVRPYRMFMSIYNLNYSYLCYLNKYLIIYLQ